MKFDKLFVCFLVVVSLLSPLQVFIYSSVIGLMFYLLFCIRNIKVIYSDGASVLKPRGNFKYVHTSDFL